MVELYFAIHFTDVGINSPVGIRRVIFGMKIFIAILVLHLSALTRALSGMLCSVDSILCLLLII